MVDQQPKKSALVKREAPKSIPVIRGVRESFVKNRNESFKQLMSFNMDVELEKAERNLSVVNATQTFVNKAMKNNITQKRLRLQ